MLFVGGHPRAQVAGAMDTRAIVSWVVAHDPPVEPDAARSA
jgi:hypothetical protein